ncbi:MAG: cadherin repeat domain-containing protein, partial [Pirellula sp.]
MRRLRQLRFETMEQRRVLASVISEVHINPLFGNRDTDQYIELRGTPNSIIPAKTYFVVLEGWGAVPGGMGYIHSSIDLSGLAFGSNGFLVIAQSANPYQFDFSSNRIISTAPGFSGLPNNRWSDASTLSDRLAFIFGSATFMLIEAPQAPAPAGDADANDDGGLDGAAASWNVIDSVGLLNTTATPSRSYGKITFSQEPNYLAPPSTHLIDTDGGGYVARIGASSSWQPNDWVSGTTIDGDSSSALQYRFTFGTFGDPRPLVYSGRQVNHLGTYNFDGGARGTIAQDLNGDGLVNSSDAPISNVPVFADKNQNGIRDEQLVQVVAGSFPDDSEHTNRFPNATLTVADSNNKNIGFKVRTKSTFDNAFNTIRVLSSEGIPWFDSRNRLKVVFYQEVNSVAIDSIAAVNDYLSYGRLEAYDRNDQLIQAVQTNPLQGLQRETIRVVRSNSDIKYIIAYTNDTIPESSPFGGFDKLIYTYREFATTSDIQGTYAIEELPVGTYDIRIANPPSGQVLVAGAASQYPLTVTKSEHVIGGDFAFRNNSAPIVSTSNLTVVENPLFGSTVAQIVASDPDPSQSLTYEFLGNSGPFGVDRATGAVKVVGQQIWDFEIMPPLVVSLRVSDNFNPPASTTTNITITPIDVNEPPVLSANQFTLSEKAPAGTIVGTLSASDVDAGLNGSLRYVLGEDLPPDSFSLDPVSGVMTLLAGASLNYASQRTVSIPIIVRDQGTPPLTTTGQAILQLIDVNDPPSGLAFTQVVSVAESIAPASTVTVAAVTVVDDSLGTNNITIGGTDAAWFSIVNGQLKFTALSKVDFEAKRTYSISIAVDDPEIGNSPDATSNFTLQISDVNEPPTGILFDDLVTNIPESTSNPNGIRVATIRVVDDALGVNQITFAGPDASKFELVGQDLRFKPNVPFDFELQSDYRLNFTVDDISVGNGPDANSSVTITLADVNERPTSIVLDVLSNSADESSIPTTGLEVANLVVNDDALGNNTFVLFGPDAASFEVIGNQLRVKPGVIFDFESKPAYEVSIRVVDSSLPNTTFPEVTSRLSVRDLPEVQSVT